MKRMYLPILVFGLVIGLLNVGIAFAHAELVSSTPADGATLEAAPETITLVFDDELNEQSGFTVVDATGATVGEGTLDLNDLERKTLSGTFGAAAPNGLYTVNWIAVSTDDANREEGVISFTLALAQPTTAPSPEPTVAPTAAPTVAPTTVPTVAATAQPTAAPQATAEPQPTTLIIDSPTNPGGPTLVNDDGAAAGRMLSLIVAIITVIGVTAAVVLTRRRGNRP